jgi:hypothetical protein
MELGLNELLEATCASYIRHKYNQAMVDAFVGGEYSGADRSVIQKDGMGTAIKNSA